MRIWGKGWWNNEHWTPRWKTRAYIFPSATHMKYSVELKCCWMYHSIHNNSLSSYDCVIEDPLKQSKRTGEDVYPYIPADQSCLFKLAKRQGVAIRGSEPSFTRLPWHICRRAVDFSRLLYNCSKERQILSQKYNSELKDLCHTKTTYPSGEILYQINWHPFGHYSHYIYRWCYIRKVFSAFLVQVSFGVF